VDEEAFDGLSEAYRFLQVAVGIIAIALPPAVWGFRAIRLTTFSLIDSISAHYYTPSRNLFVGALCALGVFFLSYQAKPLPDYENDRWLGRAAGAMAIVVAWFPTAPPGRTKPADWVNHIHVIAAIALFLLLGYIANFVFTRTGSGQPTDEKKQRNLVYRICGGVIAVALVVGLACMALHVDDSTHWLFWVETLAIEAFGISWLIKSGRTPILRDAGE